LITKPVFNIYDPQFASDLPPAIDMMLRRSKQKHITVNDIDIFYNDEQNGGGSGWAPDVVLLIQQLYPDKKFCNVLEWCSGPGFIGFSLLANSLCSNLYLNDIYQLALNYCTKTKQNLNEKYKESIIETISLDSLKDLPEIYQFDLIVGNPPHFNTDTNRFSKYYDPRIFVDKHWNIHKNFFRHIKKHLTKDGKIILLESFWGSAPDTFAQMIDDSDLQITKYIDYKYNEYNEQPLYPLYYLEISHK
jgi:methylase of polypeptide subunit release factors